MATCLDVITSALKLARIIAPGETPEAAEAEDGLTCLQSLLDQFRTGGMFGALEDVILTENDTAEEGKRYLTDGYTLTAPTSEYVDTYGDTRQPRDLAMYEAFDGTTLTAKLYDRTAWVDLLNLTLSSTCPLASRNQMGLAACLATNGAFAAMFGDTATLNPDVRKIASGFLSSLAGKVGTTQDSPGAEYF